MSANKGLSSRAIIGDFYRALEQAEAQSWVMSLGMYFTSDQESETYKWLGQVPQMREWVGGRHAKGFRENGITIENLPFEATLEVPVDWLRRDKTGQLRIRIDELAQRTTSHWAKLTSALIAAGESQVCYDGQYFFDTDHAEGDSGTQSNDISVDVSAVDSNATPAAPGVLAMREMILRGVTQILGFKDDQGEPMNDTAREFLVMVPTPYWRDAAAAVGNPLVGGGDTNIITNLDGYAFRLVPNARLNWTDKLAVFRTDSPAKPFILQEEEGVQVDAIAEGSELEFNERKHHYGVYASRNVGFGYWQDACLVTAG